MDEFKALREREEAAGPKAEPEEAEDGFQVVYGKKKKRPSGQDGGNNGSDAILGSGLVGMTTKDKEAAPWAKVKVPFHIATIPRPQDVYKIIVSNKNMPFEHVWLERSEDGTRPIHPLEKLPVEQFIDRNVPESEPVMPADLKYTPFTLVEDRTGLMELAKKLKSVSEFAVDLEHNQYRSFQGLTCLMQISTRTEDFIVDTLKLRILIGLYLNEPFKDPAKRKVMHGADRDIMWLQRDFNIYVCNLFDTGQASRVLQMERNSLEHLLHHFCGVTANKEYQTADWRLRPLPDEMIKYAREDTHYLLYIYDLMRLRLQRESTCENDLLLEVQNRSNEICLQLYEKELLTDTSYIHIYGLQENELSAKQLAVVAALYQWRDYMARQEDESTGYILPNKTLIEIAKQMPTTTGKLKRMVKSKYPFVERNLNQVMNIIRNATENSSAFERLAEQLKEERLEQLALKSMQASGKDTEMTPLDADNYESNFDPADQSAVAPASTANISITSGSMGSFLSESALIGRIQLEDKIQTMSSSEIKASSLTLSGLIRPTNKELLSNGSHQQAPKATVQELKRTIDFGALLGNSTSARNSNIFGGFSNHQHEGKVAKDSLQLDNETDNRQLPEYSSEAGRRHHEPEGMHTSRSPGFERGFQLINQRNLQPNPKTHKGPELNFQLKGYDYAAARKHMTFGELEGGTSKGDVETKPSNDFGDEQRSIISHSLVANKEGNFQNPRRQAFPPSGNKSATYQ